MMQSEVEGIQRLHIVSGFLVMNQKYQQSSYDGSHRIQYAISRHNEPGLGYHASLNERTKQLLKLDSMSRLSKAELQLDGLDQSMQLMTLDLVISLPVCSLLSRCQIFQSSASFRHCPLASVDIYAVDRQSSELFTELHRRWKQIWCRLVATHANPP